MAEVIGKIIRGSKRDIEGTHKMHAWNDTSDHEYDFVLFDGAENLSDAEIEKRISTAFFLDPRNKGQSSWGALRWFAGETILSVDIANRTIRTQSSYGLCD